VDKAWLSILPPLISIAAAVWSKKILPSLLLGLLVGGYILNPSIVGGIEASIESLIKILSDKGNLQVLLFLYLFSGLITLIKRAGGIDAFSSWIAKYVTTQRGVFYTLWALIPVTFIDCAFRIVGAGSIIGTLADKNKISRERIAFTLNNTASPLIELIPVATTFVGFNIANIGLGLKAAGLEKQSAYEVLLHAIPYELFSILVLVITFLSIFLKQKSRSPENLKAKIIANDSGDMKMDMEMGQPEIQPRAINLLLPLLSVICFSIFFFWYFGVEKVGADSSISSIISATDPNKAMLVALFISIFVTVLAYFFQNYSVKKMTADMISGGNELTGVLAILIVAWSLGAVSQDLNLGTLIQGQLGNSLPAWSIPVSLFLLSSAVTYFIGAGWAAASLIMPFAISLAVLAGAGIPICVGAVITGGTFGDVTSPVAGMTNMASSVAKADHMKYINYANRYNFAALFGAAVLFLLFGMIG
jgi:tetracycline resistance efflux pump